LNSFLRNNLWGLFWSLFILILVCIPGGLLPEVPVFLSLFAPDKLVHLFLFTVFVFLWIRGFRKEGTPGFAPKYPVFTALLMGVILGGGTEILQHYLIPGRIASVYDFIANTAGCFAGWGIYQLTTKLRSRRVL
jgi:hypothetical protein